MLFSKGKIFVGTTEGLFVSEDGSINWKKINNGLTVYKNITGIIEINDTLYISTNYGGVFCSVDMGENWVSYNEGITTKPNWAYWITSIEGKLLTNVDGTVYIKENRTEPWATFLAGYNPNFILIDSAGIIYLCTKFGLIKSADNGKKWSNSNKGLSNVIVYCLASYGKMLVSGTGRGIFISMDYGKNWEKIENEISDMWIQSLTIVNNRIYALASNTAGSIYLSTDGGKSFKLLNSFNSFFNCISANNDYLFAGDMSGTVYRIPIDYDGTYDVSIVSNEYGINCIETIGKYVYASSREGVFVSSDNGIKWELKKLPNYNSIEAMAVDSSQNLVVGFKIGRASCRERV